MGRQFFTGHTPQNCNFCYFFYEFFQQAVAWAQKTVYNEIRLGIMSTMLSKGGKGNLLMETAVLTFGK